MPGVSVCVLQGNASSDIMDTPPNTRPKMHAQMKTKRNTW